MEQIFLYGHNTRKTLCLAATWLIYLDKLVRGRGKNIS